MPNDPYYRSREWLALREQARIRANDRCEIAGCRNRGTICDHIVSRRNGGANSLANLRWLCREHDNQLKEDTRGRRRNAGKATIRGCDGCGRPLDPSHHWNHKG